MNRRETRVAVVHFGPDADWVREAAAESSVVAAADGVASYDEPEADAGSADATGARLAVCELSPDAGVDPLAAVRDALPTVPVLAVVADADAVDDA
ncbi:PAS sensor protein, partial [Halorubrum sp. SS5]